MTKNDKKNATKIKMIKILFHNNKYAYIMTMTGTRSTKQ